MNKPTTESLVQLFNDLKLKHMAETLSAELPTLPLAEQNKISVSLSKVDRKIDIHEKIISKSAPTREKKIY